MNSETVETFLVVIVGPTASGKTGLAIDLAKKFNGEIICADSRSIYIGADIGTAKPTKEEQKIVPHWGLDLVNPGEYFSVCDFKDYATKKISEIQSRGKIPFLVGGTGLYIDAVIFDYKFGPPVDNEVRTKLQQKSIPKLIEYCNVHNIPLPENSKNKRYLIRSIERNGITPQKNQTPTNCIIVGITTNKDILLSRIEGRINKMIDDGVIEEAESLGRKYSWDNEAMLSNIYPLIQLYLNNLMTLDEVRKKCITLDWRLAKRQLTWLRRNRFIHWFEYDDAKKYLDHMLANHK
jgi:tRNA dimethylallyltransferase